MRNLNILLKNNFNILIGTFKGKKGRSTVAAILLLIVMCIAIFCLYTLQAWTMFDGLGMLGLEKMCLFHSIVIALTVILIIGIMRVTGNPKTNDTDFLLSLPFKKVEIIIAKTLNKYLFDLFFVVVLFLPYLIIYQIKTGFSLTITLLGTATTLLLPLLSVGISYVFDFVITRIFNRFKAANLLKSLVSVFFFVLVMLLMLIKTIGYGFVQAETMEQFFADRPISNLFLNFITQPNATSVTLCLVIMIVPFVLGMFLFAVNFGKEFVAYSNNTKEISFREYKNSFGSMFKKEVSKYITTPAYIVNTIIGPILLVVFSVVLVVSGSNMIAQFGLLIDDTIISGLITVIFCGCIATTVISGCAVSMEGKNLWILKTSPINEKTLFASKICNHLCMTIPFVAIASLLLLVCGTINFTGFLLTLFIPSMFSIMCANTGLAINLWLPKMEWEEEQQVVKQSLSVLLSMCLNFVLVVIPVVLFVVCGIELWLVAVITFGAYAVLSILSAVFINTIGIKIFRKI